MHVTVGFDGRNECAHLASCWVLSPKNSGIEALREQAGYRRPAEGVVDVGAG